jgi:hypothetical protein
MPRKVGRPKSSTDLNSLPITYRPKHTKERDIWTRHLNVTPKITMC